MSQQNCAEVIVIGAGLSGLSAAAELHQQGIDVIVLEACPTIGGRAKSITTQAGSRIDLGGQWIGHGHNRLRALVEKAGGTVYKTYTRGLPTIVYGGDVKPIFSPSIFLAVIYLATFEIMRKIYTPRRWTSTTVNDAIISTVPVQLTRRLLRLLATITSTADLNNFSLFACAEMISSCGGLVKMMGTTGGAQDSLIAESTGIVTAMLSAELSRKVLVDTIVTSIEDIGDEGVTVVTASGRKFHARKLISTVPPPMLKRIKFEPPLPAERQVLQQYTKMGVVYKAFAIYEEPFWREGLGAEMVILDDPPFGVFDSTPPGGGPGHLCILVPGTRAHYLDNLSEGERRDFLLSRLAPHLGRRILQPLDWHDKAWHLDEHCGGGYVAYPINGAPEGILSTSGERIGNLHWAGTESSQTYPGYLEGAIQAGERAAKEVSGIIAGQNRTHAK